jgi:hypothetical protein
MPLRDHFHRPGDRNPNWDRVHGGWPMVIVQHLDRVLPPRYQAAPQIRFGQLEIDVGTFDDDPVSPVESHGTATELWAPPAPTRLLTSTQIHDEYAVEIFTESDQRLVAAIELVSPANKDRPESRRAFVNKCAALLQQDVCVSIVDVVTERSANLYVELLEIFEVPEPPMPESIYAVTIRRRSAAHPWQLASWVHPLRVGGPLPTLPIWLNSAEGVMLDLEATYEETCRTLRIA